MRNYFTIAGVDCRDFGVYISGHNTYGSPEKSYDEYEVPGRNGTLLGYNKRFSNAEYGYTCGIVGDFEENMANFRTFLASLDGYQRLEDSYHPDEYRMAVLMESIEPKMTSDNKQGEFDVIFSCLPQRFLKSGESEYTVGGGTITGNPIYTDLSTIDPTDITITIDQPFENYSAHTPSRSYDPVQWLLLKVNGTTKWSRQLNQKVMAGTFAQRTGGTITKLKVALPTTGWSKEPGYGSLFSIAFSPGGIIEACDIQTYVTPAPVNPIVGQCWYSGGRFYAGPSAGITTVEAFEAWATERASSGWWNVVVSTSISVSWSDSALTFPEEWGTLSAQKGTITCSINATNTLVNPTRFASKPLIRLYGNGTATINGQTITVANSTAYVDIDCDMMDCYEGSTNRNADVTFSTYDFPELVPGDNTFIAGTGITGFVVTPRWWRV